MQAVWGETGRDVLKALDTLPEAEDVLLDADDGITPPASPTYLPLSEDAEVASEQTPPGNTPPGGHATPTAGLCICQGFESRKSLISSLSQLFFVSAGCPIVLL